MNKIIIPLDFSDASINAAVYAAQLYAGQEKEFICVSIVDFRKPTGAVSSMWERMEEGISRDLDKALELVKEQANDPKHRFHKQIIHGQAVDGIVDCAENLSAEAIYMGTTGASGMKEVLIGSVAAGVIKKAKCPVMTIPIEAKFQGLDKLALATDLKPVKNMQAMDYLLRLCENHKAEIILVHVLGNKKEKDEEVVVQLEAYMKGYPHHFEYIEDEDRIHGLLNYSSESEPHLIAMLHHPYGLLEGLFKRSSVEKLAMHTHIPLLSLPETE